MLPVGVCAPLCGYTGAFRAESSGWIAAEPLTYELLRTAEAGAPPCCEYTLPSCVRCGTP